MLNVVFSFNCYELYMVIEYSEDLVIVFNGNVHNYICYSFSHSAGTIYLDPVRFRYIQ